MSERVGFNWYESNTYGHLPAGTYISVFLSYFLISKWRSWVSLARDANCCDWANVMDLLSVCRIRLPLWRPVSDWLSVNTWALDSKWSRNSWVGSSGGNVTLDSGTGNSNSNRLSAVMQTRPRWLIRLQLKLKMEWFPSLVFLMLLTLKVFLTVSPAKTGQL